MAMTPYNIFASSSATNLNKLTNGVVLTEVPGLGKVETYGRGLYWETVEVPKDNSIVTEKRDRFEKRNALLNGIAEVGSFEYALAVAPSVNGKQVAQCSFCGAHHNWVVFYRSSEEKYLGWSGTDCFSEICNNLKLPAAAAMIEAVKAERGRSEKFRKTMAKVNDFKRDFPGLYENRSDLESGRNPYRNLWWAVRNRLNAADGVDEKWLEACERGDYDSSRRVYDHVNNGYRVVANTAPRRIPAFLRWASEKLNGGTSIGEFLKILDEKRKKEIAEEEAAQRAAMKPVAPAPAPVAPPVQKPVNIQNPQTMTIGGKTQSDLVKPNADRLQQIARELSTKGFGWSNVVRAALAGKVLSDAGIAFLLKSYEEVK